MPYSKVVVQHKDGSPARRTRVVLGFDGLSGGMTRETYTNDHGEATVEHSSRGRATVYVSGRDCGSMSAPGTTVVTLR